MGKPKKDIKAQAKRNYSKNKKTINALRNLGAEASIGNQWWKLRSKHGRDTLFESPQLLKEAFNEYVEWCEQHPEYAAEWKDKRLVKIPLKRVLLLEAFMSYCDTYADWWSEFKGSKAYANNKEWGRVMKEIETRIYVDKAIGATNGLLNSNVMIRMLKLSENINMDVSEHRKAAADLFPDDKDFKSK